MNDREGIKPNSLTHGQPHLLATLQSQANSRHLTQTVAEATAATPVARAGGLSGAHGIGTGDHTHALAEGKPLHQNTVQAVQVQATEAQRTHTDITMASSNSGSRGRAF